jgi:hypothetical protein
MVRRSGGRTPAQENKSLSIRILNGTPTHQLPLPPSAGGHLSPQPSAASGNPLFFVPHRAQSSLPDAKNARF